MACISAQVDALRWPSQNRAMSLSRRLRWAGISVAAFLLGSLVTSAAQYQGWDIPNTAREEKSPLSSTPATVARGKAVFAANCVQCHGADGKGHGSEGHLVADLTDDLRDVLNPEGVLFYKVWNGHAVQLRWQIDDMPAFSGKLSKDEVWAIVEYLKVLRTPTR